MAKKQTSAQETEEVVLEKYYFAGNEHKAPMVVEARSLEEATELYNKQSN